MTPRRLLALVGVAAGLTVLGAAGVVLWSFVWPADPDAGVVRVNGRLVAEATGYVARVDPLGRELQISGSILGFRPLTLVIDDETTIVIHDKQGTLRDLAVDMPVQVRYELDNGARRARSVHLRARASADARPLPLVEPAPTAAERDPAPSTSPERPPMPATAVTATTSGPANRPVTPVPADPARREPRPIPTAPTPAPAAMPSAAAATSAPASPSASNTDHGAADGSAAIDWLINESRRR